MKFNAYAKINLGLDVIGKREDGYHEVRMIMQTIGLHDELDIERTDEKGIAITCNRNDLSVGEDNLIYKAASLMIDEYEIKGGLRIHLNKNIPVAAGLAGGSTDAAATLVATNRLFELGLSEEELKKIGVRIGADVPYCIMGGTVLAEGIGEKLTPIAPCPEWPVLIAKPPVGVSTAQVYGSYSHEKANHPDIDRISSAIKDGDLKKVAGCMGNALESVTASKILHIKTIEKIMSDHGGYPLMSGSGPTVFGLFEDDDRINGAYDELKGKDFVSDLFITRIFDPNKVEDTWKN